MASILRSPKLGVSPGVTTCLGTIYSIVTCANWWLENKLNLQ